MSAHEELRKLHTAAGAAIDAALNKHSMDLGEVHQLDLDVAAWLVRIDGPERAQLEAARRELAYAEYTAAAGLYRQAFATLRLFLELSFAAVYFSVRELERRQWLSNRLNFSWSAALSEEDGLLSTAFVREFTPTGIDDAKYYSSEAAECYRYCSQFIHGKASFSRSLPEQVRFETNVVQDWCTHARQAAESVLYLLYIRYGAELDVSKDDDLQQIMISRFGHLAAVRTVLDLAGDKS